MSYTLKYTETFKIFETFKYLKNKGKKIILYQFFLFLSHFN